MDSTIDVRLVHLEIQGAEEAISQIEVRSRVADGVFARMDAWMRIAHPEMPEMPAAPGMGHALCAWQGIHRKLRVPSASAVTAGLDFIRRWHATLFTLLKADGLEWTPLPPVQVAEDMQRVWHELIPTLATMAMRITHRVLDRAVSAGRARVAINGTCPMCLGHLTRPITGQCGHAMCALCAQAWVESELTRPIQSHEGPHGVMLPSCPNCRGRFF